MWNELANSTRLTALEHHEQVSKRSAYSHTNFLQTEREREKAEVQRGI